MKAPFARQGGKQETLEQIIKLIPPHNTYCELFAGSAILFFNLPKAKFSVLNDLDHDVYERLKLLQKAPLNSMYASLDTLQELKNFYNLKHTTIADKIIYHRIKANNGFNVNPVVTDKHIYKNRNPHNITKNLEYYKEMLKGVKITNKDYLELINKYDKEDTFFFLDPPYENTPSTFYDKTEFDYERLANRLKSVKGNFMLTINDSKYIRKVFKGFVIKPIKVKSQWLDKENKSKSRNELLIMNYRF